jgi:ribosomal protein S12 methylthiotransferase
MKTKTFYLESLGCAKNTVDSDSMAALLEADGYKSTSSPARADVLIVNTCGFIAAAREESFQELKKLSSRKKPDQVLIAAGCLTQRYGEEVAKQVKGIDGILGTRRWMDIVSVVQQARPNPPHPLFHMPSDTTIGGDEHGVIRAAIQGKSAYLKIADGCRRNCAFCSIPMIKGTAVSRPMNTILDEAIYLRDAGIQEIILIAQDTTDYGHDLGLKDGLSILLKSLIHVVPDIPWIRIMYAFPGYVTDRLIDMMSSNSQILRYLDIPLQHADAAILRSMKRPSDLDWVRQTIEKMRNKMTDIAIRSTFIVGYPGEMEQKFEKLLAFLEEMQFDRVGVFPFSFEQGTPSEPLGDPIPEQVKQERVERMMTLQQSISLSKNQKFVGKLMDVLIEGKQEDILVGRSYRDAPEIDGLVIAEGKGEIGEIIPVRITGAMAHDVSGVVQHARPKS